MHLWVTDNGTILDLLARRARGAEAAPTDCGPRYLYLVSERGLPQL